jgi:hypothetical protein
MDYILYRNEKIHTVTLPKNTLLFRFSRNPEHDLRGVEISPNKFCLTPNYNVFFYPSPFVNKLALPQHSKESIIHIYILDSPVRIVKLLKPSKYTRGHRHSTRAFIKNCNKTRKLCLPRTPRKSDPCFTDTIVNKYPDVVGMMGFAQADVRLFKRKMHKLSKQSLSYLKFAEDINGVKSVPEIVLYPLKTRNPEQIISSADDKLDNSYRLLKDISIDESTLNKFMKDHTVYNPETFTFTYKE